MRKRTLIFNTIMLMFLPVHGFAETLDPNKVPQIPDNTQTIDTQNNIEKSCYGINMLAYKILKEKYHKIPLENSSFYNADKNARLNGIFGKSLPELQALTKTIYELPYVEDLQEREKQLNMVEGLVTASCTISLTS